MDKKTQLICTCIGTAISYIVVQTIFKKRHEKEAEEERKMVLHSTTNLMNNVRRDMAKDAENRFKETVEKG